MQTENETPGRAPLDPAALRRAAIRPDGLWRAIEVVERTGSTNADLLARAQRGEPEGTVLVTEHQQAGRGRMGRTWITPPRAALTFSVLVRPQTVPPARRGWLPLLAGVAVTEAITAVTELDARLKWPNDVLADQGKIVGILAEAAADAIVVGIGLNVSTEAAELPGRGPGALPAASLLTAGAKPATLDRGRLLLAILDAFERRYRAWHDAAGDPDRSGLRAEYASRSGTIGRQVRAELPGGQALSGFAVGVDADGRLLVRPSAGASAAGPSAAGVSAAGPLSAGPFSASTVPVAAADVVHLR